jgi:hypothetical protein
MRTIINILVIFSAIIVFYNTAIYSQELVEKKWLQVSGRWKIVNVENINQVTEEKIKPSIWGYDDIINNNSIVTNTRLNNCDKISCTVLLNNPVEDIIIFRILYFIQDHRSFHSFEFTGDRKGIDKVHYVKSDVVDASRNTHQKWNFSVQRIKSSPIDLRYGRKYHIEVLIKDKTSILFVDGKKAFSSDINNTKCDGKIGFSSNRIKPYISNVEVYSGKNKIFYDDFSTDSITRWGARAVKVK